MRSSSWSPCSRRAQGRARARWTTLNCRRRITQRSRPPYPTPPSHTTCRATNGARTNGARSHLQVIYTGQLHDDAGDGEQSTPARIKAFAARHSFAARKGPEVCRVPPPPPAALAPAAHNTAQATHRTSRHLTVLERCGDRCGSCMHRDRTDLLPYSIHAPPPMHPCTYHMYVSHAPSHTRTQL